MKVMSKQYGKLDDIKAFYDEIELQYLNILVAEVK